MLYFKMYFERIKDIVIAKIIAGSITKIHFI